MHKSCIALFQLLLLICFESNSQETRNISLTTKPISGKEIFYVLKSDKSIKHGEYKREINNSIVVKGQYNLNKKIEIWEFYDFLGKLEQKFNYSENRIEYSNPEGSNLVMLAEQDGEYYDIALDNIQVLSEVTLECIIS